ncbi:MAG TPA: GNAT family N-acetyltransferase [Ktedonobacterales bacterium]|jgi:predicted N-acetyltransferase YhbS|nr:GNAT family N-acetyltransferase [Ktedonobacterales bacterium]
MSLSIQPLADDLLDEADRVMMAAFRSPSRRDELAFYRSLQPNSWLVATLDGATVGAGGVTCYGPFAWLGLMAVDPAIQRRGIGQALVEALIAQAHELGCEAVLLDASNAGAPVYARVGFVEDDRVRVYARETQAGPMEGNPEAARRATPLTRNDLPALVDFDARYFGASREALLAASFQLYAGRVFATRDESGSLTGYLVAQEQRLGPWVATTPEAAEALLAHALALPYAEAPSVLVPTLNCDATDLLERIGFTSSRELRHMRHGGEPGLQRRERIYGQASFAIG